MDLPYNTANGLIDTGATPQRFSIGGLRAWFAGRREIARISRELHSYSDGDLADLGLRRTDISDVARGVFRRG